MSTQPTQLPVPSESPTDLKFNAGKIDEFVTSKQLEYQDRFGVNHYTIEGLRWVAQQAISKFGYITIDSFQAGATLSLPNQILRDTTTGEYYRWDGQFPPEGKVVPSNSTPANSGGIGVGAWISVGDASLRSDLQLPDGASLIGFSGDGNTATVEDALLARPTLSGLTSGNGSSIGYQYSADSTLRAAKDRLAERLSIVDFIKPEDSGDASLALNRIFSKYASAESFHVNFPPGRFYFKTQVIYSGTAQVSLQGSQGTFLNLSSSNKTANISIVSTRRTTIQDLEIEVSEPGTNGAKVAFFIKCSNQDVSHNIRNVRATATINTSGRAVIMFDIMDASLSSFSDVYVRYSGSYGNASGSNNIAWRMNASSKISTDSMYRNCSVVGCEIAWLINPPVGGVNGAYLEGVSWVGCTIVDVMQGVYVSGDSSNSYRSPMYRWLGGHINAYQRPMYFYWASQISVSDAYIYLPYDATKSGSLGLFGIWIEQTIEARIHNVGMQVSGQPAGQGQGVHIGPGCNFTSVSEVSCFVASGGRAVVSYSGSLRSRVRDAVALYSGTAPSSAISLNGTGDVDLGGNAVYAQ